MNFDTPYHFLETLKPIAQLPLTWDDSGYTSATFNLEVAADTFDGWDGDLSSEEEADVMVHLLQAKPDQSLLDVACGYGRHALVFANDYALQVTGIDIAPGLIATAKRLAEKQEAEIVFQVQHARDLKSKETFDHAVIAYNTFSVFGPDDAPSVLRAIHTALKPDGKLFLDLDNKPFYCRYGSCYRNWYLAEHGLVLQEVFFHHEASVEVVRDVTLSKHDAHPIVFTCFKRIYARDEILQLLADCGFEIEMTLGNWDLTPYQENSPKIIVVAKKR